MGEFIYFYSVGEIFKQLNIATLSLGKQIRLVSRDVDVAQPFQELRISVQPYYYASARWWYRGYAAFLFQLKGLFLLFIHLHITYYINDP